MSSTFISFVLRTLFIAVLISSPVGCSGDRQSHKLFKAIDAGDADTVGAVLDDETFDLRSTQDSGAQFLFHAMTAKNKAIYVKLLEKGASPNHCDHEGRCVMNEAAEAADSYWLTEALAHGGDPDAPNTGNRHYPGWTPLFYAINERQVENTKILINAGADVNHRSGFGNAPLHEVEGKTRYDSMVALLEAGADPTQPNKHGRTFADWFKKEEGETDDFFTRNKNQLPWYRKVKEILTKRGLIKNGSEE
jgi:ankyrin repeat protein